MKKLILSCIYALLLLSCVSTAPVAAKPIAAAEGDSGAYVVLGDDTLDACPVNTYAAIGKDINGVQYIGCWFYEESTDMIRIYWITSDEYLNLPKDMFTGIEEPPSV